MRNTILILIIISIFCNCSNYDYKITELSRKKVKFIDLPQKLQNFYHNSSEYGISNPSLIDFACIDQNCSFSFETIATWYGPWVDYYKLIDQSNMLSYRINQGTPIPIVVYQNKLYLVDKFNIFTNIKEYSTLEFTQYELK